MVYAMRSILILQIQLWLLIVITLTMTTARSPLEILSSSVRAIQLTNDHNNNNNGHHITSSYTKFEKSEPVPSLKNSPDIILPIEKNSESELNVNTRPPPAFVLFAPKWNLNPILHNVETNINRRQDEGYDMSPAESSTITAKSHPQQIVVAWPAGLELPSRKIPLRFIAAMAVPVTTYSSDPLLTQGELSEVVYYSSMDLRKLNITGNNNLLLKSNQVIKKENLYPTLLEEEPNFTESENVTPYYTEDPQTESTSISSVTDTILIPTTFKPKLFLPTSLPTIPIEIKSDIPVKNSTESLNKYNRGNNNIEDDRQRRSWYNDGSSNRVLDVNIAKQPSSPRGQQWMDGESVAYIAVGTCCGISVLTLAIVLLVLRVRGNYAAKRRGHFSNVIALSGQRKNGDGKNSSLDSQSNLSDSDSASIHLPQRLLNLMNNRSQEVSTHKLGSWFNGRPTLSIRHGANMAFPAPIRSFHEEEEQVQNNEQNNNLSSDDILEVSSTEFIPEESNGEFDFDESDSSSSNSNNNDAPQSLEPVLEGSETSSSADGSLSGSKHDTFIFWSTNSDRLV